MRMAQTFRKPAVHLAVGLAVFGAVAVWVFSRISPGDVAETLLSASPAWLAGYAVLALALSGLRTVRYQILLRAAGHRAPVSRLFLAVLVRGFCVDMLPARTGELVYVALLRMRLGIPTVSAAANFGTAFLMDLAALGPLILWAAALLGSGTKLSPAAVVAGGAVITAVSLAVLFFLPAVLRFGAAAADRCRARFGMTLLGRLGRIMSDAGVEVARIENRRALAAVYLLSVAVRVCKYAALYSLLAALLIPKGYSPAALSPALVFVGLCSAEMAASLPMSGIAGFGAYEGTWALVFALLGFPGDLAMTTGVAHHLVTQAFAGVLGIAAGCALYAMSPLRLRE